LPHKVFFINKELGMWPELAGGADPAGDLTPLFNRCIKGSDIYTVQSWLLLKRHGVDVHLASDYVPGAICVAPYDHIAIKDFAFDSYVVAVRDDRPRAYLCDHQVVETAANATRPNDHFIPMWSQPTTRPRDPARGTAIKTLVFKGLTDRNLAPQFRDPVFFRTLAEMGVEFRPTPPGSDLEQMIDWADFREADLVLAARNLTRYDASLKPGIKLINAWRAGVPALLGPEPSYMSLRRSDLDYLEIRSAEDALAAIRHLKANPDVYTRMIENGFERAKEFSSERIAQRWYDVLAGPVAEGYERWRRQRRAGFLRPITYAARAIVHMGARKVYRYRVLHGDRILDAA
jgi:hypothetical protein